jgi:hypothetical protein
MQKGNSDKNEFFIDLDSLDKVQILINIFSDSWKISCPYLQPRWLIVEDEVVVQK